MRPGAFFLDRDGTINIDRVYINDPRLMELIPGAAEAIARVRAAGFLVIVVTNQSGIGRGIIEPGALPRIHARLDELLAATPGAAIDRYEICPHAPQENCQCRKPSPRLVENSVEALGIDLARSVFVGDKLTDVATGRRAGCAHSILVRTGKGGQEDVILAVSNRVAAEEKPDFVADDLTAAVAWALGELK